MNNKVKTLLKKIGVSPVDVIAERRGSLLLRVVKEGRNLVLKLHVDDDSEVAHRKVDLLVHEANILSRIPELTNQLYVAHGQIDDSNWLLIRAIEGDELNVTTKQLREIASGSKEAQLSLMANLGKLTGFYDRLYRGGYLHGDVQPAHCYLESGEVTVIDWGLSRKANEPNPLYKGGFVYFVAPEIAEQMVQKKEHIQYTSQAEVYGIGATMFLLYTGSLAIDFGAPKHELKEIPIGAKLKRATENRILSFSSLGLPVAPELERFLGKCLTTDLKERFSDPSELHSALIKITS